LFVCKCVLLPPGDNPMVVNKYININKQMQRSFVSRSTCFPFVSSQFPFPARPVLYTLFFLQNNSYDIYSLCFNRTEMQRQQQ